MTDDGCADAHSLFNRLAQVLMAYRLGNEIRGAALHRFHHLERRGSAGKHDDGQIPVHAANIPQRLQAVFARHHDIEQHERDPVPFALEASQYLFPILRRLDGVSMAPQSHLQIAADFQFVLAHQDGPAVAPMSASVPRESFKNYSPGLHQMMRRFAHDCQLGVLLRTEERRKTSTRRRRIRPKPDLGVD